MPIWAAAPCCVLLALAAICCAAEDAITIASGYAPGGETSLYAQTIAKYIAHYSGHPVNVIYSETGGNGGTALHWLSQQPADGLHIATAPMPFIVTLPMYPGCPYRLSDVSVISWSAFTPGILFVHTSTAIYTWPQLLDAAEAAGGFVVPGVSQQFIHMRLQQQCSGARRLRFLQTDSSALSVKLLRNRTVSVIWGTPPLYLLNKDVMRPIVMGSEVTPETLPRVPLFSEYGIDIRDGNDRGLAVSSKLPVDVQHKVSEWVGNAAANLSYIHEIQSLGFLPKYIVYPQTNAYVALKYKYYHAFLFPQRDRTWVAAMVPSIVGFLSVIAVVVSGVVIYRRKRRKMFEQFEEKMSKQALARQSPATTVLTTLMEIQQFVPPELQARLTLLVSVSLNKVDITKGMDQEAAVFFRGLVCTDGSGSTDSERSCAGSVNHQDSKSSLASVEKGDPWCLTHYDTILATATKYAAWDYDPREASKEYEGHALQAFLVFFFNRMGLLKQMKVDKKTLCFWAEAVEDTYVDNPFHSQLHAADVVQSTSFLLSLPTMCNTVTPEQAFVCLTAAAAHDCAHPGRTNAFIVESKGDLAITYNDRSVLENHHLATFFRLCAVPKQNIFKGMPEGQCRALRKRIIDTVLATDLASHFAFIEILGNKLAVNFSPSTNAEDMAMLVCTIIKCADLSNSARPREVSEWWTQQICEEFFQQGDEELKRGMKVSAFMDRRCPRIPRSQVLFIDNIQMKIWKLLSQIEPVPELIDQIEKNREFWNLQDRKLTSGNSVQL
eukprot:m51a1_g11350 putative achain catalytic domain of human phosphodiesterase 4d in complex with amp (778) ;mRNA; f:7066-9809